MTTPHYIGEDKSDMRSIKAGWYAIESVFWTSSQLGGMRHENQSADEVATGLN